MNTGSPEQQDEHFVPSVAQEVIVESQAQTVSEAVEADEVAVKTTETTLLHPSPRALLYEEFMKVPEEKREASIKELPMQTLIDHVNQSHSEWKVLIGEYKEVLKKPREENAAERDNFIAKYDAFQDDNFQLYNLVSDTFIDELYPVPE